MSDLAPWLGLIKFLMDYRCTPLLAGYSPSKLQNGLQSYGKIDVLLTSPAHQNHGQQSKGSKQVYKEEIPSLKSLHRQS